MNERFQVLPENTLCLITSRRRKKEIRCEISVRSDRTDNNFSLSNLGFARSPAGWNNNESRFTAQERLLQRMRTKYRPPLSQHRLLPFPYHQPIRVVLTPSLPAGYLHDHCQERPKIPQHHGWRASRHKIRFLDHVATTLFS